MRIMQINAVCDYGSTGRICRELNDALLEEGHEGIVLYGNGNSEYGYAKKVAGKLGVKAHGFLARSSGRNAAYSPLATRKILDSIRTYKPDLVHLHNLHGNYVNIGPLLRYLARNDIPTVISLHDCWFYTGKCTHYTEVGCDKWQTGCEYCPKLRDDIPSYFFDRTRKMWREKKQLFVSIPRLAVIGVSDWITGEARKSFLTDAKIVERIYNWIDLDVFCPRTEAIRERFGISEEKFTILCIGAGWNRKSSKTADLLTLADQLDENCQIVLAGSVPFDEELPSNIKYVGYISDTEELASLYSVCDVYVHLSREDTFGKVIAEAMACGTPAIVYRSTACPEIVGEGCGFSVETGNIEAVLAAILEVKKCGKARYSQNCIDYTRRNFSKDQLLRETFEVYRKVCNRVEV